VAVVATAYLRLGLIEDFSYPMTVLFHQAATIFPIYLYFFISRLLPQDAASVGGDYFTFSAIGLATTAVLQNALADFGYRVQRAQDQGHLETLLIQPVSWLALPFGMSLWPVALGSLAGTSMLFLAWLLGAEFAAGGLPTFLLLVVLGIIASTGLGLLSGALMLLSKRAQPLLVLYGFAASLLGGALFPITLLPDPLRWLSYLVPHMYVINGGRVALMSEPPLSPVTTAQALIGLAAFDLVILVVGLWLFSRALQYARRTGLLGGY